MSSDGTLADETAAGRSRTPGDLRSEIANAVVALAKEHLGRGPESAQVTIDRNLIVVLLRNGLGTAERTLVSEGQTKAVLTFRSAIQDVLRPALTAEVQRITGRRVKTFMSANALDPDYAAELFLLE